MRKLSVALFCIAACLMAAAQQGLNNDSIIKLAKAGLSDDVVIATINGSPGQYNTSADGLIALKQAGVSDRVIAAMVLKGSAPAAPAAANTASPYDDMDIGVYYDVKGSWTLVASEPVNWKTGGVLKSLATDGIVKGDVNGRIGGPNSATKVTNPVSFLIRTPDGVEATDFQLVHLHQKADAREFRTVTGGVFHASGGSQRDAVRFDQVRVAKQTYKVTLPADLAPGEYGFLAPGLTGSSASGSTGKAYTFHLLE